MRIVGSASKSTTTVRRNTRAVRTMTLLSDRILFAPKSNSWFVSDLPRARGRTVRKRIAVTELSVYWWKTRDGGDNLGDALTSVLLSDLFGVQHKMASFDTATMLGAGSTLGWIWSRPSVDTRKPDPKLAVLGSGFMHPQLTVKKVEFLKIFGVRGYLSKSLLGENDHADVKLGDPGLLASRLYERSSNPTYKYGVIPHIAAIDRPDFHARFENLPSSCVIDFRTSNLKKVMEQMSSCEIIISQSLHGLIIADSLGIPNIWIDQGPLHPGGPFKFYDYFSSVNRPFDKKISRGMEVNPRTIASQIFEVEQVKLRLVQDDILQGFHEFFMDFGIEIGKANDLALKGALL